MLVPYSKYVVVASPFGSTVPLSCAVVSRRLDAGFVTTVGTAEGKNVWSAPRFVPASLDATSRKWYRRPVVSPVTAADDRGRARSGARVLRRSLRAVARGVPYSKYHVVERPFGLTVPFSVADVEVTELALPVAALGVDDVCRIPSLPRLVPAVETATSR